MSQGSNRPPLAQIRVKVEGLIEPPLAQMASTKACYKLGLRHQQPFSCSSQLLANRGIVRIIMHNVTFTVVVK